MGSEYVDAVEMYSSRLTLQGIYLGTPLKLLTSLSLSGASINERFSRPKQIK